MLNAQCFQFIWVEIENNREFIPYSQCLIEDNRFQQKALHDIVPLRNAVSSTQISVQTCPITMSWDPPNYIWIPHPKFIYYQQYKVKYNLEQSPNELSIKAAAWLKSIFFVCCFPPAALYSFTHTSPVNPEFFHSWPVFICNGAWGAAPVFC